jgi:pimeloyl-ACP methyl ester carboxylesterase
MVAMNLPRKMVLTVLVCVLTVLVGCASSSETLIQDTSRALVEDILTSTTNPLPVFIHGAGDDPSIWSQAIANQTGGYALDWAALSKNRLQAPALGYRLGLLIGKELSSLREQGELGKEQRIVLIAHSAGAWLAQGIIDGLEATMVAGELVDELVFLDPFTAKSLFQPFAGQRLLGKDFPHVRTYFTTLDPIPFTSGKVAQGEIVDVSSGIEIGDDRVSAHWLVIDVFMRDTYPTSL